MESNRRYLVFITIIVFYISGLVKNLDLYSHFPQDLRNRVVGSRMVHDDKSPYFYTWKEGDNPRYYDVNLFANYNISHVTATPFLLHLMYPLAKLEQTEINKWWFIFQYSIFILCTLIALYSCKTNYQCWLVLLTATLILFSEAWKYYLFRGQYYIIIPFLGICFYLLFINASKYRLLLFLSGIVAMSAILIKPNSVLIFIPLLVSFLKLKPERKSFLIMFSGMLFLLLAYFSGRKERSLWADYLVAVKLHVKMHQADPFIRPANTPSPPGKIIEGIPYEKFLTEDSRQFNIHNELSSIFFIFKSFTSIKISGAILFVSFIFIALLYLLLLYNLSSLAIEKAIITGGCLFILSDFFSQIQRPQYYAVLWLLPLLIASIKFEIKQKKIFLIIITGLVLNILNTGLIKMEHTIGEILLVISLSIIGLMLYTQTAKR